MPTEAIVRLHFSKDNDALWDAKGTKTIEIGGVTVKFNHWGTPLEGRDWARKTVHSSLNTACPQNPDSYKYVADVPAGAFFRQTGIRMGS